jgi:outer membrane murein-binding lipoprotein Lpp
LIDRRDKKTARVWVVGIALLFIIGLAISDAVLALTPAPRQPSFIDTILASKAAVAAIRIAIVFAAGFLVLSVIALAGQRRWLTRVGPVEVSNEVVDLREQIQRLEKKLEAADEAIEALDSTVAYTQQLVDRGRGI